MTAYTVKTSTGLNLVIINKDNTQNLQLTAMLPQSTTTATLLGMNQLSAGTTAPNLTATSGVTIQGATVNPDGTLAPAQPYTLTAGSNQINCYVRR